MSIAKPEKPTLWDVYQEGDFIDAKDNQADWRVGYIVAKVDHSKTFKVRFDGWSSKYDEVLAPTYRPTNSIVTNCSPFGRSSSAIQDKSKIQPCEKIGNLSSANINKYSLFNLASRQDQGTDCCTIKIFSPLAKSATSGTHLHVH